MIGAKMVEYYKGYRIPIYPTDTQAKFINRCIELNRYIYNWTIDRQEEHYKLYKEGKAKYALISKYEIEKMFTKLRNENEWIKEVPYNSARNAIFHCLYAYKMFLSNKGNHPKYKSKKRSKQSFETRSDRFFFEDNMLRIEGLPKNGPESLIVTKFYTGFKKSDNIKYISTVITKDNLGQYWISFNIKHYKLADDYSNVVLRTKAIGIDLNVKNRIVLSTGEIFKAPDTSRLEKGIKNIQSKVSRDRKRYRKKIKQLRKQNMIPIYFIDNNGQKRTNSDFEVIPMSKSSQKRLEKYRKKCKKLANINRTFHHTITKQIVEKYRDTECIVMEDLYVRDIESDHYIAKNTSNIAFREIREMMEYKCNNRNMPIMFADKEYPSSQLCSNCGNRRKIGSRKTYICPVCGLRINRDINAAINLSNYYYYK